MHEPGPPRTTTVGDSVELAPRSPDSTGTYEWTLTTTPAESDAADGTTPAARAGDGVLRAGETSRGDTPVVHLHPDASGEYVLELDAPDGTHRQRVRVFPDERVSTTVRVPTADLPLPPEEVEDVSVMAAFNDRLLARDRPEKRGDEWVWETRLQPGRHRFSFVANDDLIENPHQAVHEVEGPGRPHCSVDTHVEADADTVRLSAHVGLPPNSTLDPDDAEVAFLVDDRDADPETVADLEARAADGELVVPRSVLPEDGDGLRVHVVPHAERLGAAKTVRIEPDPDGAGSSTAADATADDATTLSAVDPHATPEWATSPTVYEVYVRSFAGDTLPTTFTEIERRVPYIESLGVDVLWLTPVLASPTDHGYHVTDFFDTAADLGDREAFESLVERCHDAGVRVVVDLVINHTSRDHPAFQMHAAGVEAYADHYARADEAANVVGVDWAALDAGAIPEYYFNWGRIPNLNFDSLAVRRWLLDVVDEWADVVDGFRADVAWGVPHGFWKEVADRVPEGFLLLDETIPHDPFYGEGEFHVHYDTSLYRALRDVGAGRAGADAIADALDRATWLGFGERDCQMRYVENHDEERYLAEFGEHAQRAAAAVTFTLPGAPMIYAGQERGNEGSREPIRWHDGDNDLTDFYRDLVALRNERPVLRNGRVDPQGGRDAIDVLDGDAERVTAYRRVDEEEAALVVVNFGSTPATVRVPTDVDPDCFAGRPVEDGAVVVDSLAVLPDAPT